MGRELFRDRLNTGTPDCIEGKPEWDNENVYHVPKCPAWDSRRRVPKGMVPDYSAYKIPECVHPEMWGCKGCEHSHYPELFDGGCKRVKWERNNIPKDEHRMLIEENYR